MYVLMIYPRTTRKAWINWKRHNLMPCYHIFIRYGFHVQSTIWPCRHSLVVERTHAAVLDQRLLFGPGGQRGGDEEFCAVLS